MARTISAEGLALLMRLEGFMDEPRELPDGRFVCGYGHVTHAPLEGAVSEQLALAWLREDLKPTEAELARLLTVPLSQAQYDALVSFAFSLGPSAFAHSRTLFLLNEGDPLAAAIAMDEWRFSAAGEDGPRTQAQLAYRRAVERSRFLDGSEAAKGAPSAALRPVTTEPTHAREGTQEPAATRLDDLEVMARLGRILADNPDTARALAGPLPATEPCAPAPASAPAKAKPPHRLALLQHALFKHAPPHWDVAPLAAMGLAGAAVAAMGLSALTQDQPQLFLLFAAPGALMALIAAYHVAKLQKRS